MNFLQQIETACRQVGHTKKDQPFVMISLQEESGELAQELKISHGRRQGPAGKDGVVGEAIDTILCALDLIYSEVGHLDETYLTTIAAPKIAKWLKKEGERAAETNYLLATPPNAERLLAAIHQLESGKVKTPEIQHVPV